MPSGNEADAYTERDRATAWDIDAFDDAESYGDRRALVAGTRYARKAAFFSAPARIVIPFSA